MMIQAAAKMIAKQRKKDCRLAFVASLLGYFGLIGYSSYAPAKHALLGQGSAFFNRTVLI